MGSSREEERKGTGFFVKRVRALLVFVKESSFATVLVYNKTNVA